MKFTKIKYANEEVELVYTETGDDNSVAITQKSTQEPTPQFQKAFRDLHKHVPGLTDMPEKYLASAEVTSVHLSYDKDGQRSLVSLSVKRPVKKSNSPLVFTTPNLSENELTADDPIFTDIDKLCRLARGYVNGERSQTVMFEGTKKARKKDAERGQTNLVDEIEAEKKEGARLVRQREAQEAFAMIMGPKPDLVPEDDAELQNIIMRRFDEVQHVDNDGDPDARRIDGLYRWERPVDEGETPSVVWCQVSTEGGLERYWFDVLPEKFDAGALVPTALGPRLVRMLRTAWGMELPDDEQPEETEPEQDEPAPDTSAADYRKRIRPAPMPEGTAVTTEMLMQAVHSALFDMVGGGEKIEAFWFELHRSGATDEQLQGAIDTALHMRGGGLPSFRFNEAIGLQQNEKGLVYHNVEISRNPLRFVVGKGRKRKTMDGDTLVAAVRTMLEIPELDGESIQQPQSEGGEPYVEAADESGGDSTASVDVETGARA